MTGKTFVMTLAALGWAGAALSGEPFRYVVFDYNGRRCLFPDGTVRTGENTIEIEPRKGAEITYLELQLN